MYLQKLIKKKEGEEMEKLVKHFDAGKHGKGHLTSTGKLNIGGWCIFLTKEQLKNLQEEKNPEILAKKAVAYKFKNEYGHKKSYWKNIEL